MRWWPRRHDGDDDAKARAEQEAKLRRAQRETPAYRASARVIADLPPEEFADRVSQAFRRRPA